MPSKASKSSCTLRLSGVERCILSSVSDRRPFRNAFCGERAVLTLLKRKSSLAWDPLVNHRERTLYVHFSKKLFLENYKAKICLCLGRRQNALEHFHFHQRHNPFDLAQRRGLYTGSWNQVLRTGYRSGMRFVVRSPCWICWSEVKDETSVISQRKRKTIWERYM